MPDTNKRPLKVFLCHAHSDAAGVRAFYTQLTNDGVDAWLDKEKLLPGQDWEFEIRKAVREADVVLVCLSKQFNQAGFRQKEVRLALDTAMEQPEGEIFIIPARLEECAILESLRKWHWVDLFEEGGYSNLMKALIERAKQLKSAITMPFGNEWSLARLQKQHQQKNSDNVSLNIDGNVVDSAIVIGNDNIVQMHVEKSKKISEEEIREERTKYLQSLVRQTEYVDQRGKGLSQSVQLKLDEVYVSLTAARHFGRQDAERFKEFSQDEDDSDGRFNSSPLDFLERDTEIVDLALSTSQT